MKHPPSKGIENGSFDLAAHVYAELSGDRDAVAVPARDGQIALSPLSPASVGGSLAKILNARAARVVHAGELLGSIDIDDSDSHELAARRNQELAALTFPRPKPRSS